MDIAVLEDNYMSDVDGCNNADELKLLQPKIRRRMPRRGKSYSPDHIPDWALRQLLTALAQLLLCAGSGR